MVAPLGGPPRWENFLAGIEFRSGALGVGRPEWGHGGAGGAGRRAAIQGAPLRDDGDPRLPGRGQGAGIHLLTAGNYGYFRDELYYVAAGERLQFGYVDFPPFVALVAAATRAVFGDSLTALHLPTVLAGAAVVVLAGLMTRRLGGGRFAQGVAALAVLIALSFLAFGTWLSMDAFDQLFWVAAAYVLIGILQGGRPSCGFYSVSLPASGS